MWFKHLFGHKKVRYKRLRKPKNRAQRQVLFALANLYLLRRPLMT